MTGELCIPISSGSAFLKGSLAYLDCAGRQIGSSGYQALTSLGSPVQEIVLALLTIFVAWQGLRLMFGRAPSMSDAVVAVAKIGVVLMLTASWPAVQTLFYDTSFSGPTELVQTAGGPDKAQLDDRLQRVDSGIVALTSLGTGRLDIRVGQTAEGQPAASAFGGIAVADAIAFGAARIAFLFGALAAFGLLRLSVGAMIALLPIVAGFLLFDRARGLFMGWIKTLFGLFAAGFAVPIVLLAEVSILESWLNQVIAQRSAFLATPSAPTELLALTLSFAVILWTIVGLIIRACLALDLSAAAERMGEWRENAGKSDATVTLAQVQPRTIEPGAAGTSRAQSLANVLEIASRANAPRTLLSQPTANRDSKGEWLTDPATGGATQRTSVNRARTRTSRTSAKRDQR